MSDTPSPAAITPPVQSVELPTLALVIACYGAWLLLTQAYGDLPSWLLVPCISVLLTFHSSLQHEILHGHPTRSLRVNRLLGLPPLSLWIPYDRFRDAHLRHHRNERLTDPLDDPESNYWTPEAWNALPRPLRLINQVDATLLGRVLVGSWWRIGRFLVGEARAFSRDEPGIRGAWITHLVLCIPVLAWVTLVCEIPLWFYIVGMVVPGNGILLIRSYAEHRATPNVPERTATVEDSRVLGPLFLFNNLHALHHEEPWLPWYRYNKRYRERREELRTRNGGLVYSTYVDLARRYLFRPHDRLEHPTGRVPSRAA